MDHTTTNNPAFPRIEGESKDTASVSGNSATLVLSDTNLLCVEYPGVVNNVDRMLDSIGGEEGVSKVIILHWCFK